MRTLDSIQADIVFLSKQKSSFFSRLFNDPRERIAVLRMEEEKFIDAFLYANNPEYRKLADANTELLKNTHWAMTVTEHVHGGRNLAYTTQIEGEIQAKGYVYGNRVTAYSLVTKNPSGYIGKIDHLGKLSVEATNSGSGSFAVPKTLKCFTDSDGTLTIEKDKEEQSFTYDTHIKSVMGDPFNGNEQKRQQFLHTRQLLFKLIADKKIKFE